MLCDNAKSVSGFGGIDPNPLAFRTTAGNRYCATVHRWSGLESPFCWEVVCACQPASPCVVPAGNPSAGYGGRGVGVLYPPVPNIRFSSHALPATFIGGGFRLHARSPP